MPRRTTIRELMDRWNNDLDERQRFAQERADRQINPPRVMTATEVERRFSIWEDCLRDLNIQPWQQSMLDLLNDVNTEPKEIKMPLTRKDYTLIAEALAELRPDPKQATIGEKRIWAMMVRGLATRLEKDSLSFNRDLFYAACGYTGEGL